MAIVDLLFNTVGHTDCHLRRMKAFDLALCENDEVAEWYRRAGWASDRIHKIPSGVNLSRFSPGLRSADLVTELSLSPEDVVIGFLGRLSEEKAPDVFVDIAARCSHVKSLRFIMTGAGPMRTRVQRLAKRLPPWVRFDFLGMVDDVLKVLRLCDLVVVPSRVDGRPMIVLESLACGIPVVASKIGGIPDLIVEGKTGFMCEPANAEDFTSRIVGLANQPDQIAAMKIEARGYAVSHFDESKMVHGYEKAFFNAIAIASGNALA